MSTPERSEVTALEEHLHAQHRDGHPRALGLAERRRATIIVKGTDDDGNEVEREVDALDLAQRRLELPDLNRVVRSGDEAALYYFELLNGQRIPIGSISKSSGLRAGPPGRSRSSAGR